MSLIEAVKGSRDSRDGNARDALCRSCRFLFPAHTNKWQQHWSWLDRRSIARLYALLSAAEHAELKIGP
jgi:hypothetical protein